MRPTMKSIAAAAGCSVMTVSLALRDNPKISEETRVRIREVATQMGYRPNPMVATLMTHIRSSRPAHYQANLAFVTARAVWNQLWIQSHMYEGVKRRADELGFLVDLFWLEDYEAHPGRLEKILRSRNIQGVIMSPLRESGSLDDLGWSEWSAACVGSSLLSPRITRVTHHQFQGMSLMLDTLYQKGYRRIGLAIDKMVDDKVGHAWTSCAAGFQLRLPPEHRLPLFLQELHFDLESLREWLSINTPEVVIGHDALLDGLQKLGLRVPEEIAFAHVNLPSQFTRRNLSGLNQNWTLVGAAVVDSVVAQIHRNERGIPDNPKTIMVDGSWVEGDTAPGMG